MKIVPIPVLVAERYLYLPSVAFSLAAAAALSAGDTNPFPVLPA